MAYRGGGIDAVGGRGISLVMERVSVVVGSVQVSVIETETGNLVIKNVRRARAGFFTNAANLGWYSRHSARDRN